METIPEPQEVSIRTMDFSNHSEKYLLKANIDTVELLLVLNSRDKLNRIRGIGKISQEDIIKKMREKGYAEWAERMEKADIHVHELNFSSRTANILCEAGKNTVESLLALDSLDELVKYRGVGKKTLAEIIEKMREQGYVDWADRMEVNTIFPFFSSTARFEPFHPHSPCDATEILESGSSYNYQLCMSVRREKVDNRTACFTGHRLLKKTEIPQIKKSLESVIEQLLAQGVIYYGCGGAIGFDMLAGFTVLEMKKRYPQIRLIMVLPCKDQDIKWRQEDKDNYKKLLKAANKYVFLQDKYTDGCMQKRNRHLVDNSGVCIAYLTENRGGTFYTVNYAVELNRKIINIADILAD